MEQTRTMDWKWFDQALTTLITIGVSGAAAWILGTFRKVDKKTVEEMIKVSLKPLHDRLEHWEIKAEKFATQGSIDSLKSEMERSIGRVEKSIDEMRKDLFQLVKDSKK